MTTDVEAPGTALVPPQTSRLVGLYCVVLMTLYNLAAVGLIGVPVAFILKNQLHLTATQQSTFGFFTDSPYFVGFAFGFLRDRWRPWGKGDRFYFSVVPIAMALVYVWMAYAPHTFGVLVSGMIAISALSALLGAAAQGVLSAVAKDFGMTGRMAVVALVTVRGSMIYTSSLGGWLGENTGAAVPFLISAVVCLTVLIVAFWRPSKIFRSGDEVFVTVVPEGAMAAIKRLVRHRAVYVPAVVLFLFEFAPGWGTPLLYFLTNTIKLSEAEYGVSQGWLRFGQVAAALSYSWLCTRLRFKTVLRWGTFLGVLGGPAFLLIRNHAEANPISLLAGISCGIALASYYDLLVRSCPKELEGVAFMLTYAAMTFAGDVSDIFGSYLYEKGGFGLALAISTAFTALIFVPVALVPKQVLEPREGDRIVDPDPPALVPA